MATSYPPKDLYGDVVDVVSLLNPESRSYIPPSRALSTAQGTSVSRGKAAVTSDNVSVAAHRNVNAFDMCIDAVEIISAVVLKENENDPGVVAQSVTTRLWVEAGKTIRREFTCELSH